MTDPHHPFRVRLDQQADQIDELQATIRTLRVLLRRSYGRTRWYRVSRNQWRYRSTHNRKGARMTTETTTTTTEPDPLPLEQPTPPDDNPEPDDDEDNEE